MLEPYTPFELVPTRNPLFEREKRLLHLHHDPNDMGQDNFDAATPLAIFQFLAIAISWAVLRDAVFMWVVLLYLLITLGIDFFMVANAVNLWHNRSAGEQWDVIRLTCHADADLVTMYSALSQLRTWRVFKVGATLRLSLFVIVAPALLFILPAAVLMLPGVVTNLRWFEQYAHYYGLYAFGCAFMAVFISESLWSLQTVPLVGIAAAIRFHDSVTAISVGLGVLAAYRFAIVFLVWGLVNVLLETSLGVAIFGVLVVGVAFVTYPLVRRAYRAAQAWLTTLAVQWLGR